MQGRLVGHRPVIVVSAQSSQLTLETAEPGRRRAVEVTVDGDIVVHCWLHRASASTVISL
jgi:hypothetical protein